MISIADQVFEELEHDILSGEYERDEILTEMKLSERLGVSRTPIREAMRRLEQEHIIEPTSKGARVIGITKEDIADICEIRLRLEGLAARFGLQVGHLAFPKAADVAHAGNPGFLHFAEILVGAVTHVGVEVGERRRRLEKGSF